MTEIVLHCIAFGAGILVGAVLLGGLAYWVGEAIERLLEK